MTHLPILRAGRSYESLTRSPVHHFSDGSEVAQVSQANAGLISRDLRAAGEWRRILRSVPIPRILGFMREAAALFCDAKLPLGDGRQSPAEYIEVLSATTGMPHSLCRMNMEKLRLNLDNMEAILGGLTRGLDLSVLEPGTAARRRLSYRCETECLGAVLPSNSPAVHALWLPALALQVPVVLKPGGQEPWTPYRLAQALFTAGLPREAISYYPTDYSGANEILMGCQRSMLFGHEATVAPWRSDPRVQIHGPGWSKVLLMEDQLDNYRDYLDLMVTSIVANGGRSCINASSIWVTGRVEEIAEELGRRLAGIEARSMTDPEAGLSAFSSVEVARQLSRAVDDQMGEGARDVTRAIRGSDRVQEVDGAAFLLPTLVHCSSSEHPLVAAEYLFPFATIVEVPQGEMLQRLGPTLVATAITGDTELQAELLESDRIERLNLGPIATPSIAWDQPHEGNLFEFLFRQRALQLAVS